MDIERRLKDHLAESGQRIEISSEDPTAIMNARPQRSGKVLQVMTAVLLVAMAGAGFWMLSAEDDGITEIAAGEAEEPEEAEDKTADGQSADGADGDAIPVTVDLELVNITSDISPGGGQAVIDGGIYYLLSTAPGRVKLDWENQDNEEMIRLTRPNSFYVYSESSGWSVSTVEDRFVSDFDVKDGVLYVISTGSINGSQASIGTSNDKGQSWDWQDTNNLPKADQVSIMATDDQPLVFGSRWGNANYDDAIKLAASAGVELTPMALYNVDNVGFTYVPLDDENRCDFVLSQFLPGILEMREYAAEASEEMGDAEFEAMREAELGWINEEVTSNGCKLPADFDQLTMADLAAVPQPVTKTWDGLGVTPPDSWEPWAGIFQFDGTELNQLELPYGSDVQTGYSTKSGDRLVITVYDAQQFDGEENYEGPAGETVFITTDGVNWTEEYREYPASEDDYAASAWTYDDLGYKPPVIGDRSFRMWWDEAAYEEEPAEGEEWTEPTPELQQKVGTGSWESISVDEIVGDIEIGDRQLWEVRGSSVGVFLVFGPRWDESGGPSEDGQVVLYSSNGVDWESVKFGGQNLHYINNTNELLLFSTDYEHDDGNYSVTETYLVRPKG